MTGSNSKSLLDRFHAAALRVIAGNELNSVGRDGRARFSLEDVIAHGRLADIVRELHAGEVPEHDKKCAARSKMPCECNCRVRAIVESIGGPLPPRVGWDVTIAPPSTDSADLFPSPPSVL